MLVRELIAGLMECNPDATVIVYSHLDEGADFADGIMQTDSGDERDRPYVKGDWPDRDMKPKGPVVIIGMTVGD